ncbi:MAG TPA: deoxyribonuclease IV [Gemmata sp.]
MPLFGAHLSISRGLHLAITSATALGCDTVQLFTKNASQWAGAPLTEEAVTAFRRAAAASNLRLITAHDSYLINLASPNPETYARSVAAFVDEMERAEALGIDYLVTHPGAHTGSGDEVGLARVIEGYDEVHARCLGFKVRVLIETTAGQGTALGHRFEHLSEILDRARCADRMGVCFDTCHVFAAGYGLAPGADYADTFQQFDDLIGLARLKLFHVNDSAKPQGSRVDRHAGIGRGEIGEGAFRRLVTDPRFRDLPMILETPKKDDDGNDLDAVNLALLRRFVSEPSARAG